MKSEIFLNASVNQSDLQKIRALFVQSAERLQRGDARGAVAGFEKLSEVVPEQGVVWYNLGLCYQHMSRHAKALAAYERALQIAPENVEAMVNLGLSYKELEQPLRAMQCAADALQAAPRHVRALNLLGTLQAEGGKHSVARDTFRKAFESEPADIDARYNFASALLQTGEAKEALEMVAPLLADDLPAQRQGQGEGVPRAKKPYEILQAKILLELRRFGEAAEIVKELGEKHNDDEVLVLEMTMCERVRDYFGVIRVASKLISRAETKEVSPGRQRVPSTDLAHVWNALGSAYFQLDSMPKAARAYEEAIEREPQRAEYHCNRGLAYSAIGKKKEAEGCYRKSIALNPQHTEAYRNLATLKKFTEVDADAQAMQAMWEEEGLEDGRRIALAFALGKVYDDVGEYKQAFAAYQIGNRLKFAEAKLDFAKYFSHMDAVAETFTVAAEEDEVAREPERSTRNPAPIFILGMPRSGTTLVEQILSRHGEVSACGELPCIEKAIGRLENRCEPKRRYPWDFQELGLEALHIERDFYISWVKRLHEDLRTPFFTDKMPFNFVHIWLIKALFPGSPVVHCRRHPLDVVLSNYFQVYASDVSFVYDLEVLAEYYVRYHRLMRHWRGVFGRDVYTVRYEALVSDQEAEIRRLVEAVGLDWSDACLDAKASTAAVRTASIWQVRQGIYTSSKMRWRNYEGELKPAIAVLQREGVLDGGLEEVGG